MLLLFHDNFQSNKFKQTQEFEKNEYKDEEHFSSPVPSPPTEQDENEPRSAEENDAIIGVTEPIELAEPEPKYDISLVKKISRPPKPVKIPAFAFPSKSIQVSPIICGISEQIEFADELQCSARHEVLLDTTLPRVSEKVSTQVEAKSETIVEDQQQPLNANTSVCESVESEDSIQEPAELTRIPHARTPSSLPANPPQHCFFEITEPAAMSPLKTGIVHTAASIPALSISEPAPSDYIEEPVAEVEIARIERLRTGAPDVEIVEEHQLEISVDNSQSYLPHYSAQEVVSSNLGHKKVVVQ